MAGNRLKAKQSKHAGAEYQKNYQKQKNLPKTEKCIYLYTYKEDEKDIIIFHSWQQIEGQTIKTCWGLNTRIIIRSRRIYQRLNKYIYLYTYEEDEKDTIIFNGWQQIEGH